MLQAERVTSLALRCSPRISRTWSKPSSSPPGYQVRKRVMTGLDNPDPHSHVERVHNRCAREVKVFEVGLSGVRSQQNHAWMREVLRDCLNFGLALR